MRESKVDVNRDTEFVIGRLPITPALVSSKGLKPCRAKVSSHLSRPRRTYRLTNLYVELDEKNKQAKHSRQATVCGDEGSEERSSWNRELIVTFRGFEGENAALGALENPPHLSLV